MMSDVREVVDKTEVKTTRLNININEETARQLRELAAQQGTSITNIVRRAVGIYSFLDRELSDDKKTLQILDTANDKAVTLAMI